MKHLFRTTIAFLFLFMLGLPGIAPAQGTVFTYQGHMTAAGTNFGGSGKFKFALVTGTNASYTTFWSNDGTSVNGNEPTAAVSVTVSNGLFTVVLGDATLTNMTSISASVFNQANLRLRIWFSDGVSGSLALDPPQNLTPTPYAVVANNLANGLTVQPNAYGSPNMIGGSSVNYAANGVIGATIGGGGATNYSGVPVTNAVYSSFGTVGGGFNNTAQGFATTVSGGTANWAYFLYSTVGGGAVNTAGGDFATVAGGNHNSATNLYATVPGGYNNTAAGFGSFAAGQGAQAVHDGSFVWSDGFGFCTSTAANQFSVRANGGVILIDGGNGVAIGLSGQYFASGSYEKLRTIRGVVDALGNRLHGTDFTVTHPGTGQYTVTFNSGFSDFPAVTVSAQSGNPRMATTTNVGNSSTQIRTFDMTGAAVDSQFAFIASGLQ